MVRRSGLGIALAAAIAAHAAMAPAIEVGELAPEFTLQDIGGASHTLSALRGKAVLLAFIGYG